MIATLDYPKAKLVLEANTDIEKAYRAPACAKEPWTVEFIEAIPAGAVFWDVGANTGPYTLIAAHLNLTVVAIEPAVNNFAALYRNLGMNNFLERCLILWAAVGEKSGFDWFHYSDARAGSAHHVLGGVRRHFYHKQLVPVWALDELAQIMPFAGEDRPQYIKLDVDGNELLVLKGAMNLLRDARTAGVQVEMPVDEEKEITDLLTATGWKLATRIDNRQGRSIGEIIYGQFVRP